MKNFKKITVVFLAALMMLSVLTGCADEADPTGGSDPTAPTGGENKGAYTVKVTSRAGVAMAGVDVYVYADSTLADLKQYGQTDENGTVSFDLPQSDSYAVELRNLPKGYQAEKSYPFSGTNANIIVTSSVITGESLSDARLSLGDVMYDFTVTTPDGKQLTLSEVLQEKKMVLLNFWYTTCQYCVEEFPYMQQAYDLYSEDIEIIAVNPLEGNDAIESFQASMGLTFPMAACPAAWSGVFNLAGYPTSIMIDRYGVICLIESGGIPSLRPFTSAFDHFTADDYKQVLCGSINELVSSVRPTYEMDTSENIGAAINMGDIAVTYRPETEGESAEYSWPFILTEKNGETCLKASNQLIESSYAILYADVELKAGQAVGFDYLISSEALSDILYVIVNDEDIYQISGVYDPENWKACYPWVAEEDGVYEVALCYLKDGTTDEGDDTVYIKDMRVVDAKDIEVTTYIPRYTATTTDDGMTYTYADIFFNETDGYYHVGSVNGPLLLADLMGYTQFNEEKSLFFMVYDGDILVDGKSYYDEIVDYFTLASNSALNGVCTVNKELAEHLKLLASIGGFDGTEDEWLKLCKYFQVYGAGDAQLVDPIQGLAPFCALKATLGKNVETNYFYYDRAIIPRGLLAAFVPSASGVYRFTSYNDSSDGVEGWIMDENGQVIYTYEHFERMYEDNENVSMVYYMEAGKSYYIDIAFWDVYQTGYIYYDVEYLGKTSDIFSLASPGYFTYDTDAAGQDMYYTISGGIDVVLGADGYYYHDLGNGKLGSKLYADFTGITGVFNAPIASVEGIKGLIDRGAFDFSKSEDDLYILAYLEENNFDVAATDAKLKALWGAEYDAYAAQYKLEDVYEGIYHGKGEDLTEEIRTYLDDIITTGAAERHGCVPVTERLAEILQLLMEKYTFENVDCSWPKLCYYYQHFGPEA